MAVPATDEITLQVRKALEGGPYACTSLVKLSGGTANFVYRGNLVVPLKDGTKTIVIKHTEGYVAQHPAFKLTPERCDYEQTILTALHQLPPAIHDGVTVQTPHLYNFSSSENTQIYSDLPSSTELKTYVLTHTLTQAQCSRLGQSIGLWAKQFHSWAAATEQEKLREAMKGTAMKELKYSINYPQMVANIAKFPAILEGSSSVLEDVANDTKASMDREEGQIIHGDFWSGNVLLSNAPFPPPNEPLKLFIVDWELSHMGSIAFDLGQMFAELFELKHYKDIDAGVQLIEAFMEGYGKIGEGLAFKTAIHIGTHLIGFGTSVQGWGTTGQVEACAEVGRDFVVNGWKKDKNFFEGTALKCLFV